MKTASIALTRVCVLGGDWNGWRVDGFNEFRESETYCDFDSFERLFEQLVREFPYVHYDDEHGRVVRIHDNTVLVDYDRYGVMLELEVRRLETPDYRTLRAWYDERKAALED